MCSTTLGPAICPSLVTWPTSSTAVPFCFAKRIRASEPAFNWDTVPGAASIEGAQRVWIESMTAMAGGFSSDSVARMSETLVSVASSTGASSSPSRCALRRTWAIASSPEI